MPFATANDLKLYYEIHGEGPRLLILQGSGSDLRNKPNIFQTPLCAHFEMLAFDQRGQGQSDTPDTVYSMADYADDAKALLDAVGWESCVVLGISFGGMVAQELVLRHPSVVDRLILACTSSGGEGGASYPIHEWEDDDAETRVAGLLPLFDVRWHQDWPAPENRPKNGPKRLERLLKRLVNSSFKAEIVEGLNRQLEARKGHDTFDRLPQIKCPVWLCGGRFDAIAPPINMIRMNEQISQAHLILFNGGHLFYIEDPKAFSQMIQFLLGELDVTEESFDRGMDFLPLTPKVLSK